jgi:cell wall-associated NlpC family hydrolase
MSDACVALSPVGRLPVFVPASRHSAEDRVGGLAAAELIARLAGSAPPSGGRRARRAAEDEPTPTPPAGLTGSFFTGAGVTGTFRSVTSAVTGTFPAALRSPKAIAAAATVTALGAGAVVTGMPNPAQQVADAASDAVHLAAANDVLPGLSGGDTGSDVGAPTTGADVANQATQVLPAVPQDGPGQMGGSVQTAMGAALGTLPQVLGNANAAQAEVLKKAEEARQRASSLRSVAAGAVAGRAVAGASVADAVGSVSGLGAKALAAAQTRLGMPYQWGATGPNAFDCSGLTSWAFQQVGITLPRTSAAQSTFGTAVSKDDLQPGDLVFFYSPVSHVGIYMGDGKILHASESGEPVKISDISSFPFHNARRI